MTWRVQGATSFDRFKEVLHITWLDIQAFYTSRTKDFARTNTLHPSYSIPIPPEPLRSGGILDLIAGQTV
jgi:hypothetical protein